LFCNHNESTYPRWIGIQPTQLVFRDNKHYTARPTVVGLAGLINRDTNTIAKIDSSMEVVYPFLEGGILIVYL